MSVNTGETSRLAALEFIGTTKLGMAALLVGGIGAATTDMYFLDGRHNAGIDYEQQLGGLYANVQTLQSTEDSIAAAGLPAKLRIANNRVIDRKIEAKQAQITEVKDNKPPTIDQGLYGGSILVSMALGGYFTVKSAQKLRQRFSRSRKTSVPAQSS